MAIQLGYDVIDNLMVNSYVFQADWIISAIVTFFSLLIITKDVNKWKSLGFPVMVGWHISGLQPFSILYIVLAIMFTMETVSLQLLGSLTDVVNKGTNRLKASKGIEEQDNIFSTLKNLSTDDKKGFIRSRKIDKELENLIKGQRGR